MKLRFLIFLLFVLFETTGRGQVNIEIPKEFVETVPPKVGSDEWLTLNHDSNEFQVSIVNNKLGIKKAKTIRTCELAIEGGTLVGINRGEWGGRLSFQPTDTAKKVVEIKRGNIKFIFNHKGKVYFMEGLAHMGYRGGAIFELNTEGNNFTFAKVVDFDDAPEAFVIYEGKFLVATHENFYIVENFKKTLIFKETCWSSLYPNSIAVLDENNVFMGIRSGIMQLDLAKKTMKFYRYKG